jgi:hypothetical protein
VPPRNRKAVTVRMPDEATVRTVADAHRALVAAFGRSERIVADVSGLREADVTFIQLLISARLTAGREGKTFSLSAPASGALLDTLKRGGFLETGGDSFWLQATGEN